MAPPQCLDNPRPLRATQRAHAHLYAHSAGQLAYQILKEYLHT